MARQNTLNIALLATVSWKKILQNPIALVLVLFRFSKWYRDFVRYLSENGFNSAIASQYQKIIVIGRSIHISNKFN